MWQRGAHARLSASLPVALRSCWGEGCRLPEGETSSVPGNRGEGRGTQEPGEALHPRRTSGPVRWVDEPHHLTGPLSLLSHLPISVISPVPCLKPLHSPVPMSSPLSLSLTLRQPCWPPMDPYTHHALSCLSAFAHVVPTAWIALPVASPSHFSGPPLTTLSKAGLHPHSVPLAGVFHSVVNSLSPAPPPPWGQAP